METPLFTLRALLCQSIKRVSTIIISLYNAIYCKLSLIMNKQQLYVLYCVWPYGCQSDYCIEYYVDYLIQLFVTWLWSVNSPNQSFVEKTSEKQDPSPKWVQKGSWTPLLMEPRPTEPDYTKYTYTQGRLTPLPPANQAQVYRALLHQDSIT